MNQHRSLCAILPAIVLALAAPAAAVTAPAGKPNIVFLLTDDQCTNSLGCYGNPDVKTPYIDRLARDGIAFDHYYNTTAICMASRASIMTGKFEFRHGCNFEHGALLRKHWMQSYPVLLRKAGYLTAMAGKIGIEVAAQPEGKGILPEEDFDHWGAGPGQTSYVTKQNKSMAAYAETFPHSTRSYGAFGRDFIRDAVAEGRPFCLSISFKAPHKPATPDPLDDEVYAGKTFGKPANFGRENGLHFPEQSRLGRQYERFHSWNYSDKFDEVMATYHQQIHAIDVAVGMIRAALERNRVADNTVVIFTSDNGFFCGAHGYGSKVLPYEESSRVPLIIFDPRHQNSGKKLRCAALTGNVDIAPTILELAGVKLPDGMDGKSLLPLYDDPEAVTHEWLPLINVWGPPEVHCLGMVAGKQKYIYWPWADGDFTAAEELYDLAEDPMELANQRDHADYQAPLEKARRQYDALVNTWKTGAVPYHDYQRFGVMFDRSIPWSGKVALSRSPSPSR